MVTHLTTSVGIPHGDKCQCGRDSIGIIFNRAICDKPECRQTAQEAYETKSKVSLVS